MTDRKLHDEVAIVLNLMTHRYRLIDAARVAEAPTPEEVARVTSDIFRRLSTMAPSHKIEGRPAEADLQRAVAIGRAEELDALVEAGTILRGLRQILNPRPTA
jgi:hypothetical protein